MAVLGEKPMAIDSLRAGDTPVRQPTERSNSTPRLQVQEEQAVGFRDPPPTRCRNAACVGFLPLRPDSHGSVPERPARAAAHVQRRGLYGASTSAPRSATREPGSLRCSDLEGRPNSSSALGSAFAAPGAAALVGPR